MSSKQRKQNYIDSHVQGALLKRICAHWLIFFLVSTFAILVLQTLLGDPSQTLGDRIRLETGELMLMGIVMISLFPAFMLDAIRFSNRFVGPIARFRRHLRELKNGKTNHCSFRNHDFWAGLADEFNEVADLVASQNEEITRLKNELSSNRSLSEV